LHKGAGERRIFPRRGALATGEADDQRTGSSTFWRSTVNADTDVRPLTLAILQAAFVKMQQGVISPHIHMISGHEWERGEGHCIECGALVVCHDR
jgi:hypothetical protein